jgi:hypothetical protein
VGEAFHQVERALAPEEISVGTDLLQERGVDVEGLGRDLVNMVATRVAQDRGSSRSLMLDYSPIPDIEIVAQRRRVERRDELRGEVRALEAELGIVDEVLSRLKQPEGVVTALAVLVYFALVGVVVPLVMLAQRPVPSGPVVRGLVIVLFVSGLMAVVGFIAAVLRRFRA